MSEGIWITPDQFISFEEINRASLGDEIATREASWDWYSWLGLLPDPDPVLRKMQEGSAILESLTADGHLCSVIQSRKLGTLKKEFKWNPGSLKEKEPTPQAVKLRDDLVEDLENTDLYNLVSGILDAPLYGMSPVEILWEAGIGRVRIKDLLVRPQRWFGFDEKNQPRFITKDNPFDGIELPFGKFVFARHFPTYDNPYGLRLLSRCFWPVAFKRGGVKFWVTLAEKYGMPFLVGKYGKGTSPAEQQSMLNKLAAMVRDAVAVVPQGDTVEILSSDGKASADIHSGLKTAMDAEMSKVIMGQTLTAEVSAQGGSRAQGQVHEDILEDFRDGDQKLVKTALEEIACLYALVNAPGVPAPRFSWFEEDEPKNEMADRDKTLKETGVNFKKSYYVRTYGFKEDEFDLAGEAKVGETKPGEFAENDEEKDTIDHLIDRAVKQEPESALVEAVHTTLQSVLDLKDADLDGLKDYSLDAIAETLTQALVTANLAGRSEIEEEEADFAEALNLPFMEAIAFFRQKLNLKSAGWTDLWQGEHSRAFTIAGALRKDLLDDFRAAVDKAVADGVTLEDFRKDFDRIVSTYGWSYNGGRGWRSRVIYETNIRTAHQAGRYQQMTDPDVKKYRPYWRYRHGDSIHPRKQHLAWDGMVLAADDPWWQTHYPPNGWGCKCRVEALSERQIKALGKARPDLAPDDGTFEWVNKNTGEVHDVPIGIDPGWAYNVGEQWLNPETGKLEKRT